MEFKGQRGTCYVWPLWATLAPAVRHALRRRRLTRPVSICEEPVEVLPLCAARRALRRAGAQCGGARAGAGREDLSSCLLRVQGDWPSRSLRVSVSVTGRSSWQHPAAAASRSLGDSELLIFHYLIVCAADVDNRSAAGDVAAPQAAVPAPTSERLRRSI